MLKSPNPPAVFSSVSLPGAPAYSLPPLLCSFPLISSLRPLPSGTSLMLFSCCRSLLLHAVSLLQELCDLSVVSPVLIAYVTSAMTLTNEHLKLTARLHKRL
uniref:Uncharacterized protein n=1 Tax=Anguilla anguilla TaxID=7936 RepID=A0A0E9P6A8_ANGAN